MQQVFSAANCLLARRRYQSTSASASVDSPVLAYFYLEHFPEPHSWCRARSSYTRSLAVSSLIGYLVGLGDRHPHNLLLHRASGELVHIDLGVAFDQVRIFQSGRDL
ncbi:hypothetical protein AHF37_03877 [Paragonimus kellicotti]|nr:hypothetical protein AHF37_03877 [Paragonimus kellicotti]